MNISEAASEAMLDLFAALFDGGTLEVRTGTRPTNVAATVTGTLLGTLIFDAAAFGASTTTANIATAVAAAMTADTTADATGTIGYCRGKASGGAAIADFTVGTTGSGADIEFDTLSVVAGGTITITGFDLTLALQDGL